MTDLQMSSSGWRESPPQDEQDEFFYWVWQQANAESDGMPECVLAGPRGETINRPDQP